MKTLEGIDIAVMEQQFIGASIDKEFILDLIRAWLQSSVRRIHLIDIFSSYDGDNEVISPIEELIHRVFGVDMNERKHYEVFDGLRFGLIQEREEYLAAMPARKYFPLVRENINKEGNEFETAVKEIYKALVLAAYTLKMTDK